MANTRIPNKPSEFAAYMVNTDNYQLANNRYQNWGWTGQESTDWHNFRSQSDTLYAQYADKRHKNTDIKDQLLILIKNVLRYDHDKNTGHHLLDKIALNGTVSDCETFRIKKGTLLQDTTLTRTAAP
ncbi:MAG: hypothetical protein HY063_15400, partial [Bacteroidetes bacterium]|nr:hypothetical protein [Bacteroidota bacterium]